MNPSSGHQDTTRTSISGRSNSTLGMGDKQGGGGSGSISVGPCYLKLLVSNVVAGSIIGQKGATIANISTSTGCTIRLSHSSCYFPGTTERVVVMWGKLDHLKSAFQIVLEKIRDAPPTSDGLTAATLKSDSSNKMMSKIVVPNSAVSQLIGKQGQTIKELQEATGTKVQISNRDEHHFKERVVTISGSYDAVCKASFNVMETIQNDPHIKDHTEINYVIPPPAMLPQAIGGAPNGLFPAAMMGGGPGSGNGVPTAATSNDLMRSMLQMNPSAAAAAGYFPFFTQLGFSPNGPPDGMGGQVPLLQSAAAPRIPPGMATSGTMSSHFDVPDNFIGFVIGKQGATLQVIQQQSGAKLHVSGKGEFVSGTENRRVTITGVPSSVQVAHALLQQKLREIEDLTSQKDSMNDRMPIGLTLANGGLGHHQFPFSPQGHPGHFSQFSPSH